MPMLNKLGKPLDPYLLMSEQSPLNIFLIMEEENFNMIDHLSPEDKEFFGFNGPNLIIILDNKAVPYGFALVYARGNFFPPKILNLKDFLYGKEKDQFNDKV